MILLNEYSLCKKEKGGFFLGIRLPSKRRKQLIDDRKGRVAILTKTDNPKHHRFHFPILGKTK